MTASTNSPGTLAPSPGEAEDGGRTAGPWGRLPTWLRRTIVFAALIGIWQLYTSASGVSAFVFSGPWDVAKALADGVSSGDLVTSTWTTLRMLGTGMAIGIALTVVLTVLAVTTTLGDDVLTLVSSMINPLPSVAILPLAMLWFGLTDTALVFVTANAVLWPMTVSVSMGLRTTPPTLLMVGRNLGLGRWRLTWDVMMPAALPHALAGLKTGWAFGWRTIIAAELVFGAAGSKGGLGFFINNARYYALIPDVFAGLVVIALIGIALDLVFNVIERRTVVRWGMKEGASA
ncbi:ABC transporter permease subunit [Actinomadura sp. LD22]|uniref:ABC transporter permease subunit n=1 Tax=Actinomadura physcomitrii TaxID=2650748 RepID=A0A6I4M3U9_9ACTN|nr:ABC transporter permease [Actinomadura physcomitrii]MVZ99719.1 ABC transporter permease subunit [Actinomadura physcomitrii]